MIEVPMTCRLKCANPECSRSISFIGWVPYGLSEYQLSRYIVIEEMDEYWYYDDKKQMVFCNSYECGDYVEEKK